MNASKFQREKVRSALRKTPKREKGKPVADINVTPLVDVVLVLLIIFMVVTPLIASGVTVDLPKTAHHDKKPDDGKDIIVAVTKDKHIYIGSDRVKLEEVTRTVEEKRRRNPEKTIYLKGDGRATYGSVREVMEAINAADIEDIMLGTEELELTEAK